MEDGAIGLIGPPLVATRFKSLPEPAADHIHHVVDDTVMAHTEEPDVSTFNLL